MKSASSALSLVRVYDPLQERLRSLLPDEETEPRLLHEAMRYAVLGGGKRFRARLAVAVAQAAAADREGIELATQAGCAIEMIHTASLIHDDLPSFGDAETRRGQRALHLHYGDAMAVLVSNALVVRAVEVMTEVPPHQAPKAFEILRVLGRELPATAMSSRAMMAGAIARGALRDVTGAQSRFGR